MWGKLGSWAGGKKAAGGEVATAEGGEDDRLHVFTVASGHMYERLQKIMILSGK